jgi:hypothetical protein
MAMPSRRITMPMVRCSDAGPDRSDARKATDDRESRRSGAAARVGERCTM